jgi:FkbM family methyltransferase
MRARDLLEAEPETIEWISGFKSGEVFYDIGANVGCYSIVAATMKCKVLAFEPSPFNYYALCRNLQLNDMSDLIWPFCVALHSENLIAHLNMRFTGPGQAGTSFVDSRDFFHKEFNPVFKQPTLGYRLDDFIEFFHLPYPDHLKIDVDGNEDKIVAGCPKTLAHPGLKSISIELNDLLTDQTDYVHDTLAAAGFRFVGKKRAPRDLNAGVEIVMFNHHFRREAR